MSSQNPPFWKDAKSTVALPPLLLLDFWFTMCASKLSGSCSPSWSSSLCIMSLSSITPLSLHPPPRPRFSSSRLSLYVAILSLSTPPPLTLFHLLASSFIPRHIASAISLKCVSFGFKFALLLLRLLLLLLLLLLLVTAVGPGRLA